MTLRQLLWLAVAAIGGCGDRRLPETDGRVDLLVFAPHPDDEVLGCGGILLQALARGERVKVVIFTNGDGFPGAASLVARKPAEQLSADDYLELARFRQSQSQSALATLGGKPGDLIFLGYPDAGLDRVYLERGPSAFRQKFTGRSETYGMAQRDYHSSRHGRAAPYTHDSALEDVVELITTLQPARICVTSEADRHPDHQAAFRFVREAVQRAGHRGAFDTYLVHGGPEWPWPRGITPGSPFDAHEVKGRRIPLDVPWPPGRRVPLSPEEAAKKLAAIRVHASHLPAGSQGAAAEERDYLESFAKGEEIFWPSRAE
jgi:LmbE family N-acetylglucosaminyl deacetylase